MMDADRQPAAVSEIDTHDWFIQVKVQVHDIQATMINDDGNGKELARQDRPNTDFPMEAISLYACGDGEHWVIMLPSEY
jgi:hypothetical protein